MVEQPRAAAWASMLFTQVCCDVLVIVLLSCLVVNCCVLGGELTRIEVRFTYTTLGEVGLSSRHSGESTDKDNGVLHVDGCWELKRLRVCECMKIW